MYFFRRVSSKYIEVIFSFEKYRKYWTFWTFNFNENIVHIEVNNFSNIYEELKEDTIDS